MTWAAAVSRSVRRPHFRTPLNGPGTTVAFFIHIELIGRFSADRWPSESACLGPWLAIQAILGDRADSIGRASVVKMAANSPLPERRGEGMPHRLRICVTMI